MSDFIFTPPATVGIPIKGSNKVFPVHRIYCVGRNYANHAIEMGHDPSKEAPFFFQKNPDNLVFDGVFPYPPKSHDVEHEIELVLQAGDIIMTGTPAGVGPVQKGDELIGHIDGLDDLVVKVS